MKRKHLLLCAALIVSASFAKADETNAGNAGKKSGISFFSDDVPRYKGFAFGVFGTNQYGLGGWGDFAPVMAGGGISAEYTLPPFLHKNLDLGFSLHADYAHIFPNKDSTLKRDDDIGASFALWMRIPFTLGNARFALQPEVGYGMVFHNAEGQNGSVADGWYYDQVLSVAPALRWIPQKLDTLEFDIAPLYTFAPEKYSHTLNQLGFRLGVVWHIDSFIQAKAEAKEKKRQAKIAEEQRLERERQEEKARKQREEEERKKAEIERLRKEAEQAAADEAERIRIEEEIRRAEEEARLAEEARKAAEEEAARIAEEERRKAEEEAARIAAEEARRAEIAAWPTPLAAIVAQSAENFTPDGDGVNDTVILTPSIQYVEETPENWIIKITDPQGNDFRTFKGNGALPESLEWDGKSDKGETVVSKNTYTAHLTVVPSRTDRLRTKAQEVKAETPVETGLLLEVIVPEQEWKIVVQGFTFDPDAATFNKLTPEQLQKNREILDEVTRQIFDHPGANVVVEGYANNVSGTKREETEELVPLSQKRAETIVEELVNRGIERETLTAKGMGSQNPIAGRRDRANWWKNRRVEFRIKK